MKRIFLIYAGIALLLLLAGCVGPPLKYEYFETEEKVDEARKHVITIEQFNAGGEFVPDEAIARTELSEAEINLRHRKLNEAYISAANSIEASKRVLRDFYVSRIATLVEDLKEDIEEAQRVDPDTPTADFLKELDNMLEYARHIQKNPQAVKLDIVVSYTEQAVQVKKLVDGMVQKQLESDISFALGKYTLSKQGKTALKIIATSIVGIKEEYLKLYPDKTIVVGIKVVGYTDTSGFREGTNLVKNLTRGFEFAAPQSGVERRRFLNQRLSQLRAENIGEYFRDLVLQSEPLPARIMIESNFEGKGEKLPPGLSVTYSSSASVEDKQRRICKIYSYVIAR